MKIRTMFMAFVLMLAFLLGLFIMFDGNVYKYRALENTLTSHTSTKEEATKALETMDIQQPHQEVIYDFTGNYVPNTSYVISDNNLYYYGQGYYMTYNETGDLVFCLELDEMAYEKLADSSGHEYYNLSSDEKNYLNNVVITAKNLYEETGDATYLVAGQVMIWSVSMTFESASDTVVQAIDEINQNMTDYSEEEVTLILYKTIGQDLIDVVVNENVKLDIQKEVNKEEVVSGEQVEYTIKVTNTSEEVVKNVVVEDPIQDENLDASTIENLIPSKGEATVEGETIVWTIDELEPNGEQTLTFNINVKEELTFTNGVINNNAIVCADDVTCKDDEVNINVNDNPGLSIEKTVDKELATAGDVLHYTLDVVNTGTIALENVEVIDPLDDLNLDGETIENIVLTSSNGETLKEEEDYVVNSKKPLNLTINKISIGEGITIEFDISVSSPLVDGTVSGDEILNTVTACYENELTQGDDCDKDDEEVEIEVPAFEVKKKSNVSQGKDTAPTGIITSGEEIKYTIEVINNGEEELTNLVITDVLTEDQLKYLDVSTIEVQDGGEFDSSTNTITWTIPSLAVDQTTEVSFTINANYSLVNGEEVENEACAIADQVAQKCTSVTDPMETKKDVTIKKTTPKEEIQAGDVVHYDLEVKNTGDSDLINVVVTDELNDTYLNPKTVESLKIIDYDGNELVQGEDYTVDQEARTITIKELPYNKYVVISFDITTYNGIEGNDIINKAQVCADEVDDCDDSEVSVEVIKPDFEIEKTSNVSKNEDTEPKGYITTGEEVEYNIEVTNTSSKELTNLVITDELTEKQLKYLDVSTIKVQDEGEFNPSTNTITWTIPSLNPKESVTVGFTIEANYDLVNGQEVDNKACAIADDLASKCSNVVDPIKTDPKIEILKQADEPAIVAGDAIHYNLQVKNTGDTNLTNVVVTDPLNDDYLNPATVKSLAVIGEEENTLQEGEDYTIDKENRTLTLKELQQGEFVIISFEIQSYPNITVDEIVNKAQVCADNVDDCGDSEVPVEVLVPDFEIEKTSNVSRGEDKEPKGYITSGEEVEYAIKVTNTGETDLTNLVITDKLTFEQLQYFDISTIVVNDGGTFYKIPKEIVWTVPELKIGESTTVSFIIEANYDLVDGEEITNEACAKTDDLDSKCSEVTDPMKTDPNVKITKTVGNPTVELGGVVHYNLLVENTGDTNLEDVVITDELNDKYLNPKTLTDLKVLGNNDEILIKGLDYKVDEELRTITLKQLLHAEHATIEFDIKTYPYAKVDEILNEAQVCAPTVKDCSDSEVPVEVLIPNFEVEKTSNVTKGEDTAPTGIITPGEEVKYEIKVTNTGETVLNDIKIVDFLTADQLAYFDISTIHVNNGGIFEETTNKITWIIPELKVGENTTVSFTIKANHTLVSHTEVVNRACAATDKFNISCDGVENPLETNPDVEIEKSATETEVQAGEKIHYELLVTNTGDVDLEDVVVTDLLNDDFLDASTISRIKVFDSEGNRLREGKDYSIDKIKRTVTLFTLPYDSSVTIKFSIETKEGTEGETIINSAQVCNDAVIDCDEGNISVDVKAPGIAIEKTSNITEGKDTVTPGYVSPGEEITYTTTVTNIGDVDLENVVVTDKFEGNQLDYYDLTTVLVNNDGVYDSTTQEITWVIDTLPIGESKDVTFTVVANRELVTGDQILNKACAKNDILSSVCDDVIDPIEADGSIDIEKSTTTGQVQAGDAVHYDLVVTNTGETNLHNVVVTDPLNSDLDEGSITSLQIVKDGMPLVEGTDYTIDSAAKTITIKDLYYTESVTISFDINTLDTLSVGDVIRNKASVCAPTVDCDEGQIDVIIGAVELEVDKTVDKETAEIGVEDLTYTISIENTSDMDAADVYLSDNVDNEFWDGVEGAIGTGHGNLDPATLSLVSIVDSSGSAVSSYDVLLPTETFNEDYAIHFASLPAREKYTVTYKIGQVPWLNGPAYNNDENITTKDRFDDYLIPNKVTGYYDYDENGTIDKSDKIGSKTVRTKLAAIYTYNGYNYMKDFGSGSGTIHLFNIGLVNIKSSVYLNSYDDGEIYGDNDDEVLRPGGENTNSSSQSAAKNKVGYTTNINYIAYSIPETETYQNFYNYTPEANVNYIPLYNQSFATATTELQDLPLIGNIYTYKHDIYGNDTGNNLV